MRLIPPTAALRVEIKEAPMPDSPSPRRRGWIDALVATALRWNDRLSRPVGGAPAPRTGTRIRATAAGPRSAPTLHRLPDSDSK